MNPAIIPSIYNAPSHSQLERIDKCEKFAHNKVLSMQLKVCDILCVKCSFQYSVWKEQYELLSVQHSAVCSVQCAE